MRLHVFPITGIVVIHLNKTGQRPTPSILMSYPQYPGFPLLAVGCRLLAALRSLSLSLSRPALYGSVVEFEKDERSPSSYN